MAYSSNFVQTVALIAAKAQHRWQFLSPERAAEFAWFSTNCDGDASIDDADLNQHFVIWCEANGLDIIARLLVK